jgi:hypothetical protein
MKKSVFLLLITAVLVVFACKKEEKSERFRLLTTPIWATETLLANGVDASGPGGLLEKFKGEAKFKEDKTGYFGKYKGQWRFNADETEITIVADSLPLPVICDIVILTVQSLQVTADVPNPVNLQEIIDIDMTFKAK